MDKKTVDRVISGHGLKEEAHDVVDWFSSSIEGQQCLSDMMDRDAYLIEDEMIEDYTISDLKSDKLFRKIDKEIGVNQFRRAFMRVAAVLLPFIVIIGVFAYVNTHFGYIFEKEDFAELYVPKGEDARLFFQDGTEVFLNSDTRIRYPKHFGLKSRDVYVDGEAYFKVKSNKRWPFKVYSQGTFVEVSKI
jgi:transmembrane sensor